MCREFSLSIAIKVAVSQFCLNNSETAWRTETSSRQRYLSIHLNSHGFVFCFVGLFCRCFFFLHIVTDCNPVLAFLLLFVLLSGLTIFAATTTITNGKFQCYPILLCLRKFAFSQTESCFCLSSFADFSFTTSWARGYFL